jgi:hypothetical protein
MKTVLQSIDVDLWDGVLDPEVAALEADSVVGEMCVAFLLRVEAVLADEFLESSTRTVFLEQASHQCDVWLFG